MVFIHQEINIQVLLCCKALRLFMRWLYWSTIWIRNSVIPFGLLDWLKSYLIVRVRRVCNYLEVAWTILDSKFLPIEVRLVLFAQVLNLLLHDELSLLLGYLVELLVNHTDSVVSRRLWCDVWVPYLWEKLLVLIKWLWPLIDSTEIWFIIRVIIYVLFVLFCFCSTLF